MFVKIKTVTIVAVSLMLYYNLWNTLDVSSNCCESQQFIDHKVYVQIDKICTVRLNIYSGFEHLCTWV